MNTIEVGFNIKSSDDWPPFKVEFLWFTPVEQGFKLLTQPFFIKNLSVGDVLKIDIEEKGGQKFCLKWRFAKKSKRSTVAFMVDDGVDVEPYIDKFKKAGGTVETLSSYNLYSLNLPENFDMLIIDEMEDDLGDSVEIIYPSFRIKEN